MNGCVGRKGVLRACVVRARNLRLSVISQENRIPCFLSHTSTCLTHREPTPRPAYRAAGAALVDLELEFDPPLPMDRDCRRGADLKFDAKVPFVVEPRKAPVNPGSFMN